jgi:hypothetical protein
MIGEYVVDEKSNTHKTNVGPTYLYTKSERIYGQE